MSTNINNMELIDKYLSGSMSNKEVSAFESKISQDPVLQQEVAFQKDIVNSIKQHRNTQLKARLSQIHVAAPSYLKYKVAAAILCVGALTYILWPSEKENSTNNDSVVTTNTTAKDDLTNNPSSETEEVVSVESIDAPHEELGISNNVEDVQNTNNTVSTSEEMAIQIDNITIFNPSAYDEKTSTSSSIENPDEGALGNNDYQKAQTTHKVIETNFKQPNASTLKYRWADENHLELSGIEEKEDAQVIFEYHISENHKKMYLLHEGEFYGIDANATDWTALTIENDKTITGKLMGYFEKNDIR